MKKENIKFIKVFITFFLLFLALLPISFIFIPEPNFFSNYLLSIGGMNTFALFLFYVVFASFVPIFISQLWEKEK